jgi:hypothetical protein
VRIGVVTATPVDSPWREDSLVVRRLAGALACTADVDLLLAGGRPVPGERDATARVLRFAGTEVARQHRDVYLRAAFGLADFHQPVTCACTEAVTRELAAQVPRALQRRLADLACPQSEGLRAYLRSEPYDVLVVAGYGAAPMVDGARCRRVVLVPLARDEPSFHLQVYDPLFEHAAAIVVFSECEKHLVRRRARGDAVSRIRNVGFVVRANLVAATTSPASMESPLVLVVRDWSERFPMAWLSRVARRVSRRFPATRICLAGTSVRSLEAGPGIVHRTVRSMLDVERLMAQAFALLDPEPNRLLGREVILALLSGIPAIVPAQGGATREHAESGNAGLWYRCESEVEQSIELLGDGAVRSALGKQGRHYAQTRYGDPEAFSRRVAEAVCSAV